MTSATGTKRKRRPRRCHRCTQLSNRKLCSVCKRELHGQPNHVEDVQERAETLALMWTGANYRDQRVKPHILG